MRQDWVRTTDEIEPDLYEHFSADLALMLDAFRFTEDLVDLSGSEQSPDRIVLRPAVGLDSGLFEWPRLVVDDEADMAAIWEPMRASGQLAPTQGHYSVATNGSPFSAVVYGALIRAKHIYGELLAVGGDAVWGEHWEREGTAVQVARDWVMTVFGTADRPTS